MGDTDHLTELRALAVAAAERCPGRWHWRGNCRHSYHLGHYRGGWGLCTVMDFVRKGMRDAQPRFPSADVIMERADTMAIHEVGEENIYRHDIVGLDHPIARWLAAADPTTILGLLDELDHLRAAASEATDG